MGWKAGGERSSLLRHLDHLRCRYASQKTKMISLESECARLRARSISRERQSSHVDPALPKATAPMLKLSIKISNLQQQLEKAKLTEDELWAQIGSPKANAGTY